MLSILMAQIQSLANSFDPVVAKCKKKKDSVKEIQDLIDSGKKQEAIDKALQHYRIDVSQTKRVTYNPDENGEARASENGAVGVGDAAFSSPGWLGSSLAHEIEIHVDKQAKKGKWYVGQQGTALQEVQAYDHELANSKRFGLTKAEVDELEKRRKSEYDRLNPEYQKRANKGNYDMTKEELNKDAKDK